MKYNSNIKKVCSFYVSDWHFVTMLLPHINEEVNEKVKIATILQTEEQTYMSTLLEKLKIENRDRILGIDWRKEELISEKIAEILESKNEEIEIIIKGNNSFIKKANEKIEQKLEYGFRKVTIINCYNVDENKHRIAEILSKHDMILNTSGMKDKNEYITNIKVSNN